MKSWLSVNKTLIKSWYWYLRYLRHQADPVILWCWSSIERITWRLGSAHASDNVLFFNLCVSYRGCYERQTCCIKTVSKMFELSWQNDVTRGRPGSGRFTVLSDCWKRFQNDRIVFLRTPTSFFYKCYGPWQPVSSQEHEYMYVNFWLVHKHTEESSLFMGDQCRFLR